MTQRHAFSFPPLPDGQTPFLEFRSTAYEFRLRVLGLFLLVGVAFGVIALLFFSVTAQEAVLLALGMCCFIFAALPRSSFAYRLSGAGIEQAELTGDRLQLHTLAPLLGAAAIFLLLAFSMSVLALACFTLGCGLVLFLARRMLPLKKGAPIRLLEWHDISSITLERRRGAMLLRARRDGDGKDMVVFCPRWNMETTLELVMSQKVGVLVEEGEVIH